MKVKDLCDKVDTISVDTGKMAYLKSAIKIKKYVPFAQKTYEAQGLIRASNINSKGEVYLNSPKQYLNNVYALFYLYTDLEITPENWVETYDMLNERGLITLIVDMIPKNEQAEFEIISNMAYSDFMENEASLRSWLGRKLTSIENSLAQLVENMANRVNNLDWNHIQETVEKISPKIK